MGWWDGTGTKPACFQYTKLSRRRVRIDLGVSRSLAGVFRDPFVREATGENTYNFDQFRVIDLSIRLTANPPTNKRLLRFPPRKKV
jgi:hypothetical protein